MKIWESVRVSAKCEAGGQSYFLAGAVFCRFHIFSVWSSEAVMRTGSTGWNVRARMPSKWLLRVNLGFHVFLMASVLLPICGGRRGWGEHVNADTSETGGRRSGSSLETKLTTNQPVAGLH